MHRTTSKLSNHRIILFNRNERETLSSDLMNDSKTWSINRKHKNLEMKQDFPVTTIPFSVLPSPIFYKKEVYKDNWIYHLKPKNNEPKRIETNLEIGDTGII